MARTIGVSRTTVQMDLAVLRTRLSQKYGLVLKSIRGRGVSLVGPEAGLRQAMVDTVMESVKDWELSSLLQVIEKTNSARQPLESPILNAFSRLLKDLRTSDLHFLKRQITGAESVLEREFSESARVALLIHLAITVERLRSGNAIALAPKHLRSLKTLDEYKLALTIAEAVGDRFQLVVPEAEVGYITLRLAGAKRGLGNFQENKTETEAAIRAIIPKMVREAEICLSRRLSDEHLLEGLLLHLVPAYHRLCYSLPIRNPLLTEIRAEYPELFEAASRAANIFAESMHVQLPDEEVAYIAIHLGAAVERRERGLMSRPRVLVLCASGVGTANLLASRLENEFPEVEVISVRAAWEVLPGIASGVDAVISTVPVTVPGLPCVTVGPMLTREDRDLVANLLAVLPVSRRLLRRNPELYARSTDSISITEKAVRLNVSAQDWVDAVTVAGQVMVDLSFVEPRYVQAMIDKIHQFGGYVVVGNGVALPHASPADGVIRPGISVVRLTHPVFFPGRPRDPVVLVIGVATTRVVSKEVMRRLNLALSGPGLDCLKTARNKREITSVFAEFGNLKLRSDARRSED